MTKQNYTHIALVVDRSGSMENMRVEAQNGLNTFVKEQKEVPGEATFTLVQFDTVIDTVFQGDLQQAPDYTLQPRGMTALFDAVGKTVVEVGAFLAAKPEDERPEKVLFVIITDGHENSSHEFTQARIKDMIQEQTDKYQWQFVFLGANIDAATVGTSIGVTNNAQYAATGQSVGSTYSVLSANTRAYRGAGGQSMPSMPDVDEWGNVIDPDAKKPSKPDYKITKSKTK